MGPAGCWVHLSEWIGVVPGVPGPASTGTCPLRSLVGAESAPGPTQLLKPRFYQRLPTLPTAHHKGALQPATRQEPLFVYEPPCDAADESLSLRRILVFSSLDLFAHFESAFSSVATRSACFSVGWLSSARLLPTSVTVYSIIKHQASRTSRPALSLFLARPATSYLSRGLNCFSGTLLSLSRRQIAAAAPSPSPLCCCCLPRRSPDNSEFAAHQQKALSHG